MWNERQRTQKIHFELERVKRELREQDEAFEELMRDFDLAPADLDQAESTQSEREMPRREPTSDAIAKPLLALHANNHVIRG
jgi:hypothetical protein